MKVYIDQSGKIENTNKLTIVCFADGKAKTLKISAGEKQKLIKIMKILDYPRKVFIYKTFAGLIFLLIKDEKIQQIIVDKKYPGHESLIKEIIIRLFQLFSLNAPKIDFQLIGKQSLAHKAAIETFRGKRKPDMVVKAREVLSLFYRFRP